MASDAPGLNGDRPTSGDRLYRAVFALGAAALFASLAAGLFQAIRETSAPPYGALAYTRVAQRAATHGDTERALNEYRGSFRVNPEDVRAGMRSVYLLEQAGRDDEALAALRDVVNRSGDKGARVRLAVRLGEAGRSDQARELLEQIVAIESRAVVPRIHLGDLLVSEGDSDAALDLFRQVLEIDPTQAQVGLRIRALERASRKRGS